jgi:hypothetical protein
MKIMANILDKLTNTDLNNPFSKQESKDGAAKVNYSNTILPNESNTVYVTEKDINPTISIAAAPIIPSDNTSTKQEEWMKMVNATAPKEYGTKLMPEDKLIDLVVEQLEDRENKFEILEKIQRML